jgi:hypothetical protein
VVPSVCRAASSRSSSYRAMRALLFAWRRLLLLGSEPSLLLLEPGGIVAFPGNAGSLIELEDPAGHVVQEVAVVGHGDDGSGKLGEIALEPPDALGIQVIGGLVEQQHVGLGQQQPAERDPAPLPSRQPGDIGVTRRQAERVHRHVHLVIELPQPQVVDALLKVALLLQQLGHLVVIHRLGESGAELLELFQECPRFRDRLFHVAADVLRGVELRFLRQIADPGAGQRTRVTEKILVHARHDPQQG